MWRHKSKKESDAGLGPVDQDAPPLQILTQKSRILALLSTVQKPSQGAAEAAGRKLPSVEDLYRTTGFAQKAVRHEWFSHLSLGLIAINALYIGYSTQYHGDAEFIYDNPVGIIACENIFCALFTLELSFRFLAFSGHCNYCRDKWFMLDVFVVFATILEVWMLPILRLYAEGNWRTGPVKLMRFARFTRFIRMIRAMKFRTFTTLLVGLRNAFKAMIASFILILFLVYIFGIVIFTLLQNVEDESLDYHFGSLYYCCWTLLLYGTFMSGPAVAIRTLMDIGTFSSICIVLLLIAYVSMTTLTIMNVLVGLMCRVINETTNRERDAYAVKALKDGVLERLSSCDENDDAMITKKEMEDALFDEVSQEVLQDLGIEVPYLMNAAEMIFSEVSHVSVETIMELMLSARGSLGVTFSHLSALQIYTKWALDGQEHRIMSYVYDKTR